ncbi:SDR family oxidoreductase [Fodinibius salsisoli]|uniref:SDR family oxidoreductase n=1 Tax=Fodinibius salsisoli TaxID=2820877 RepID=A0ABT3PMC0_9BACT|nr:SDR family oxidoreductase [Fodinibius salsisoli]MCW9707072.1 SDR family oxidoreductase [Fodinibius salsisoli]
MIISILGCGWLGLPLAEILRNKGHIIKGSTTDPDKLEILKGKQIDPYFINLEPTLNEDADDGFWDADLLILNIPAGRRRDNVEEFHPKQIAAVIEKVKKSPIDFVIFVSSTSVYPERPGVVTENDTVAGKAVRSTGNALIEAESILMSESSFKTTVLRFGGLYGYDRHPGRYMSGRKNLDKGNAPINFIHRDDCIQIIQQVIDENITGEVFNAVTDGHPPKKLFYPAMAEALGLEKPTFKDEDIEDYKLVSNQKLKDKLNYEFKYPNPMDI